MKVVLAIEELNHIHGGVERTVVNLANYLSSEGYQTTILTFERPSSGVPAYDINPGVQRHDMGLISGPESRRRTSRRKKIKSRVPAPITSFIRNMLALKRIFTVKSYEIPLLVKALDTLKPHVVISFKTHFHRYIVPAAAQSGVPVIASDHNPPDILYRHYVCSLDRHVIWHYLELAGAIRTLLEVYNSAYPSKLRSKCVSIPNGIEIPEKAADVSGTGDTFTIINVGRLYFQKDQATLIKAFARIADDYPQWRVEIYGDGDDEALLRGIIAKCGLENRVLLKGPESEIIPAYQKAQIFALPSLFEGFGNVTLEALACGLPVVAFDDSAANRELVHHEVNGILVQGPDRVASFEQGLERLMRDAKLRVRLGKNARDSAGRFDNHAILERWKALIEQQALSSKD